jgi:uncharacterized membrane protein
MPVILAIAGFLVGAGIGELWGAVALGVLGAWLGYLLKQRAQAPAPQAPDEIRRQVVSLTQRVAQLEAQVAQLVPSPGEPARVSDGPHAEPGTASLPGAEAALPAEPVAEPPAPEPAQDAVFTPPAGPEEAPPRPGRLWNWLFGGNALVRVGVLVLFFGVAFLVRYAAEHIDVPIEARLSGIALGAVAMLFLGWRLRARAGGYGLVLQGGGVGVLYLVVFGAFRIWKLLPPEPAFVLLVAIAVASAILAVAQDSRALAVAGVSGGFLAPLLASTGQGSNVALFGFYVVLNLGVLYVAWHKAWRALNLLGFAFTFGIGAIWGAAYYRPEHFATTQPFLIVFFLMYVAISVLYALRRAPRLNDYVDSVLVFGTPLVVAALQLALVKEIEYGAAWSALALGAFYCALAYRLWHLQRETLQLLVECFVALGVAFATLAIPYAFDGQWTAASWALEGAAALWVGTRQNRMLPRVFGLLLQPAAGVAFLASSVQAAATPVLNSGFVGGVTIALAGLFCAWYLWVRPAKFEDLNRIVASVLLAWGTVWWLGAGWEEVRRFAQPGVMRSAQLAYATATALAFVFARRRLDWRLAAYGALALLPVMAIWAWRWSERHAHPFAEIGYAAWPAAFAVLYWVVSRIERDVPVALARSSHCVALWLLALLGGWECAWQLDAAVGEGRIWSEIGRPLLPALLAAWIATRSAASRWPFSLHLHTYLAYALLPVVAALWLWVVYINFRSSGDPRPLPYLPLLNPLDVAVALIAVVFLLWWRALRQVEPGISAAAAATVPMVLGATGFVWANGVLLRTLHHWAEVPFRLDVMWRSTLVQASFSVFWTALALGAMVLANRRRLRALWLCGAGLLGVVVVKLFLLDLSRIGGMERIVSFLGVGVLLLVIGYLAPVPPRAEEDKS